MSKHTRGPGQPTYNIIRYVILLSACYAFAITGIDWLAKSSGAHLSLNNVVDVCKTISLLSLIYVGGEMAWHREHFIELPILKHKRLVETCAKIIFLISVFVFLLLLAKTAVGTFKIFGDPKNFPSPGKWFYQVLAIYLPFAATTPILLYSVLNGYIAFSSEPSAEDLPMEQKVKFYRNKRRGVHFFIFSNLSVLVPLAGVILLLFLQKYHADIEVRDTFLSGAIAVVLLVSSICAKAVEEYLAANEI